MGWNGEGLTDIKCPKCGARMDLMSGAWSEQPPDAFKLSCAICDYSEDMDYDKGYNLMMKMTDDFYRKAEEKRNKEKTKRVVEILNDMEKNGEFAGLTKEEKEIQRQILGMQIRGDMNEKKGGR